MTRQTKAELQTELRNLNRGYPRQPVSKMKHHELEAAIDAIKKVKAEAMTTLETKPPTPRGPPGPRPVDPVPRQKSPPVHLCNCPSCPAKSKSE
jgi:hypothetical protein